MKPVVLAVVTGSLLVGLVAGHLSRPAEGQVPSRLVGKHGIIHPQQVVNLSGRLEFAGSPAGEVITVYQVPSDAWLTISDAAFWTAYDYTIVERQGGLDTQKQYTRSMQHLAGNPYLGRLKPNTGLVFRPGSSVGVATSYPSSNSTTYDISGYLTPIN